MRSLSGIMNRVAFLCLSALATVSTAFAPSCSIGTSHHCRESSAAALRSSDNTDDSSQQTAWTVDEQQRRRQAFLETAVPGPSVDTKPDYENIIGPAGKFADDVFLHLFRQELAAQVGDDDDDAIAPGYQGIMELAATMNQKFTNRTEIHVRAQAVLRNLFPSWMPVRIYMRACSFLACVFLVVTMLRNCWADG